MQSAYAAQKASLANVQAAQAEFMPKFFLSATGAYSPGRLSVTALPSVGQQSPTVNINNNRLGGSTPRRRDASRSTTAGRARRR